MCLEQIEKLCTELVGTAPDDPHAEVEVTMTHARTLCGVIPPVGTSVGGLVPSGDVERIGVTRGVDVEEHSGGAKGVDVEPLKYHCGAELVACGGKTMDRWVAGNSGQCFRRYGYFRAPAGAAEKIFWWRRCLAAEVWAVPGIGGRRPRS